MCLENSKQAYAFLKAFESAGMVGLDLAELSARMEQISQEEFKSPRYVSSPVPLTIVLRRHLDSDGVDYAGPNRFTITDWGKKGLRLLDLVAITPERERNAHLLAET